MFKKFLLIVILLVLGSIVTLYFVTIRSPRLTEFVSAKLSGVLNRGVSIQDLKINFFKGIEVKNIAVSNYGGFSKGEWVKSEKLILKYQFLPLFQRRLVINKVVLLRPEFRLFQYREGLWNFSDLLKKEKKSPAPSKFSFSVSSLEIKDGRAIFLSRALFLAREETVKDIDFQAWGISPEIPCRIKLQASLPGEAKLKVSGYLNPLKQSFDLEIESKELNLGYFSPYSGFLLPPGKADIALVVVAHRDGELVSRGNIDLRKIELGGKPLDAAIEYEINFDPSQGRVDVEDMSVSLEGLELRAKGSVKEIKNSGRLDIDITSDELDISRLSVLFAEDKPFPLEGKARFKSQLRGSFRNPTAKGRIELAQGEIGGVKVSNFESGFDFKDKIFRLKLKTETCSGNLEAVGVTDLTKSPVLHKLEATAKEIEINECLTQAASAEDMVYGRFCAQAALQAEGRKPDDISKSLEGSIRFVSGEGVIKDVPLCRVLAIFVRSPALREVKYHSITGDFNVKEEKISTDNFKIDGTKLDMLGRGTTRFDSRIDYELQFILCRELTTDISKRKELEWMLIKNKDDTASLYLDADGTFERPRVKFNPQSKEMIKRKVEEKVEEWLRKLGE